MKSLIDLDLSINPHGRVGSPMRIDQKNPNQFFFVSCH